ncbi:MAG: ATPase [Cytophagales bacterium]|nr:ATPase [Cytophagales bacterium]
MKTRTMENRSNIFPFQECLSVLEHSGKRFYGDHFHIVEEDHEVIFKLLVYFMKDQDNAEKLGISFRKGILLTGPVGCGKTSLMNLFRFITAAHNHHVMASCRKVSFEFIQEGYKVIQRYSDQSFRHNNQEWRPKTYCFDDLGAEDTLKYFGNECNVMAEILLSRYDLFISQGMLTHITTNLNSTEMDELYGNRVRSRMREMVNLINYENGRDKRC